ncbi:MAG: cyclic nucleotide-binding domain-containing protein [Rickettsiales bacterium]|nr:cyclic nucleotide-binding domain-containing protein [Rickettsiales bacterium]
MTEVSIEAGTMIFREGDQADEAYIIREGQIEVLKHAQHGEVRLATLDAGDVLGELALFEHGMPRSASARTVTPVVCDVITRSEFEQLLGQCPPRIMPVIMMVLDRLRSSNRRVSETEAASVILEVDISQVTVTSLNEPPFFDVLETAVARLPLKVGGYEAQAGPDRKHQQNHINIASEASPPIVSSQHCQVEIHEGGIYLRDTGSRFGTIVNGKQIGRGKGVYLAPLQKGENTLQLGGLESPVMLKVECI